MTLIYIYISMRKKSMKRRQAAVRIDKKYKQGMQQVYDFFETEEEE